MLWGEAVSGTNALRASVARTLVEDPVLNVVALAEVDERLDLGEAVDGAIAEVFVERTVTALEGGSGNLRF